MGHFPLVRRFFFFPFFLGDSGLFSHNTFSRAPHQHLWFSVFYVPAFVFLAPWEFFFSRCDFFFPFVFVMVAWVSPTVEPSRRGL